MFLEWLRENHRQVNLIFHMGARTDTTELRKAIFDKLNLNYSKHLWTACAKYDLPLVYASSASTYGAGEFGFDDDHALIPKLRPLNPYGESKNDFDKWVLKQKEKPYFWAGLKFFNVYGPNEFHKGRMASVVFHTFKKIKETGRMELLRSDNPDLKDGEQLHDFIYVKDVVNVLYFLMLLKKHSGIYNLGTGQARTLLDMATATFRAIQKTPEISFVDTPEDIGDKYQHFSQAKMEKLCQIGYTLPFYSLEEAIQDYVQDYLIPAAWY